MDTLKLKKPIKIDGKEVAELTYDADEITAEAFITAESRKFAASSKKGGTGAVLEFDYSMHLELGFAAIIAVNPQIDYSDLKRIKGADLVAVAKIGRNFTLLSAAEKASEESTSESA